VLGIRKRIEYSAEHLAILRARAAAWNGAEPLRKAANYAQDGQEEFGGTLTHPQALAPILDARPAK
jgi:hypothetical protein